MNLQNRTPVAGPPPGRHSSANAPERSSPGWRGIGSSVARAVRRVHLRPSGTRSRWTVPVLGLLAVVIAAFGLYAVTNDDALWGGSSSDATHQLAYRATSSGRNVIATYTREGATGQAMGPSPWSLDVSVTGNVAFLTITSAGSAEDSAMCSIVDKATGRSLVRTTAGPASNGTVTCVLDNLQNASRP